MGDHVPDDDHVGDESDVLVVCALLRAKLDAAPALRKLDPSCLRKCIHGLLGLLPVDDLVGVRAALSSGAMLAHAARGWGAEAGGGVYLRHLVLTLSDVEAALDTLSLRQDAGPGAGPHDHQLSTLLRVAQQFLREQPKGATAAIKYIGQSVCFAKAWADADAGRGRALIQVVQELCDKTLV